MASQPKQDGREFNRLLRHLSDNLLNEDLRKMKLFLKADIGAGKLEPCSTGIDIFEEMKNSGWIAEDKTEKLLEILEDIKRIDLLNHVKDTYLSSRRVPHVPHPHSESTDAFTTIQNHLRKRYRRLSKLTPFPFCDFREIDMDHMFTNLEVVHSKKHEVSVPAKRIKVSHTTETMGEIIWNETDRTVSFIEGVAGIGKTTLSRQLAYRWSKGDNRVCGDSFDLVFLLEARSLSEDLAESIRKQLFPKDFPLETKEIYTALKQRQDKSLLIIDGLDEIGRDKRKAINTVIDLIKGEYLDDVNIILTGRPECSKEFIRYVEKHLKIKGFTIENAKAYVKKFFGDAKVHLAHKLLLRIPSLYNLIENPFMTFMLCFLTSEDSSDLPSDETDVIEKLIKTVFGVYAQKMNPHYSVERHKLENTLLSAAGKLAWYGMENDILQFTEEQVNGCVGEDLGEHIRKSGIVNTDYSVTGIEITDCCYFGHKTIQEFLCVWHLAHLSTEDMGIHIKKLSVTDGRLSYVWERLIHIVMNDSARLKVLLENVLPTSFDQTNVPFRFMTYKVNPGLLDLISSEAIRNHFVCYWVCVFGSINEQLLLSVCKKMKIMPVVVVDDGDLFVGSRIDDRLFTFTYYLNLCWHYLKTFYRSDCLELCSPLRDKYLPLSTDIIFQKGEMKELTFPFMVSFSVRTATELINSDLRVKIINLVILPNRDSISPFECLVKALESTQKRISFIITQLVLPHTEEAYWRVQSLFRRVNNSNVHLRIMTVHNRLLEGFATASFNQGWSRVGTWSFSRSSKPSEWVVRLRTPSPQQHYDRFSPY